MRKKRKKHKAKSRKKTTRRKVAFKRKRSRKKIRVKRNNNDYYSDVLSQKPIAPSRMLLTV